MGDSSYFSNFNRAFSRYGQEFTATTTQVFNSDGALTVRGDGGITLDASSGANGIGVTGPVTLSGTTTLAKLEADTYPAVTAGATASLYNVVETGTVSVLANATGTLDLGKSAGAVNIGASQTGGETLTVGGNTVKFQGSLVANDPDAAGTATSLWPNLTDGPVTLVENLTGTLNVATGASAITLNASATTLGGASTTVSVPGTASGVIDVATPAGPAALFGNLTGTATVAGTANAVSLPPLTAETVDVQVVEATAASATVSIMADTPTTVNVATTAATVNIASASTGTLDFGGDLNVPGTLQLDTVQESSGDASIYANVTTGSITLGGAATELVVPGRTRKLNVKAATSQGVYFGDGIVDGVRLNVGDRVLVKDVDFEWIAAVRVNAQSNVASISGLLTVDDVTVEAGDRVLLSNQSTASQNGIYIVAAGAWARSADLPAAANASKKAVLVKEGAVDATKTYACSTGAVAATVGTDSLTWTETSTVAPLAWYNRTSTAVGTAIKRAAWGDDKFVVLGNNIAGYSTDGKVWTAGTLPGTSRSWAAVVWAAEANSGAGLWMAVSQTSTTTVQVVTSADGITWADTGFTFPGNISFATLAFSPTLGSGSGRFVAAGQSSTTGYYSDDDGASWTATTFPAFVHIIEYAPWLDAFVAVFYDSSVAVAESYVSYVSSDAITWTTVTLPFAADNASSGYAQITFIRNNMLAMCTIDGDAAVAIESQDGTTWREVANTQNGLVALKSRSAKYAPGFLVVFDNASTNTQVSTDEGRTWRRGTTQVPQTTFGAYSPTLNRFVASGTATGAFDDLTWADVPDVTVKGIYEWNGSTLVRAADTPATVESVEVFVKYGSNANKTFALKGPATDPYYVHTADVERLSTVRGGATYAEFARTTTFTLTGWLPLPWTTTTYRRGRQAPYLSADGTRVYVQQDGLYHACSMLNIDQPIGDGEMLVMRFVPVRASPPANDAYYNINKGHSAVGTGAAGVDFHNSTCSTMFLEEGDYFEVEQDFYNINGLSIGRSRCTDTGGCRVSVALLQGHSET